jgi:flagellar M-ring protein FliF
MATSQSEVTERNFENSSTQRTVVREAGDVESLAVSVVVDQRPVRGEDGTITFESRQDQLEMIERLVAAAVGFPVVAAERSAGQILEVEQMAFSRPDFTAGTPAPEGFSLDRLDFMRIAEIAVLFITSVLIILLVARPLVRGALSGPSGEGAPALAGASAGQGRIAAQGGGAAGAAGAGQALLPEGEDLTEEERIDVAQIDGQVKKSSVRKVATLVDQHPDETMSILRTWMHEDA